MTVQSPENEYEQFGFVYFFFRQCVRNVHAKVFKRETELFLYPQASYSGDQGIEITRVVYILLPVTASHIRGKMAIAHVHIP